MDIRVRGQTVLSPFLYRFLSPPPLTFPAPLQPAPAALPGYGLVPSATGVRVLSSVVRPLAT